MSFLDRFSEHNFGTELFDKLIIVPKLILVAKSIKMLALS
jgi:hypothetical protein